MEKMNAEMMEIMVNDWMADYADEMEDLILDGNAYYNEELSCWCMDAHDNERDYIFTEDGKGNVMIG